MTATRPSWVMLKESYAPHWRATVDGKPVKTAMLAPSFVGVPVPQGTHDVVFQYHSDTKYPEYVAVGLLTLLGLAFGPTVWRSAAGRVTPDWPPRRSPRGETSRSRCPRPAVVRVTLECSCWCPSRSLNVSEPPSPQCFDSRVLPSRASSRSLRSDFAGVRAGFFALLISSGGDLVTGLTLASITNTLTVAARACSS